MSDQLDPEAPVGFDARGNMTPFTEFNGRGEPLSFHYDAQGNPVPFSAWNAGRDGMPQPFVFDAQGNRIPTVGEMFPDPAPRGNPRAALQAISAEEMVLLL